MKNFEVVIDLTLSGTFEIEAETEEEAREKAKKLYIYNFSNMHELSRDVYEIEEI